MKDKSRLVAGVIIILCLGVVGGAVYFIFRSKPNFYSPTPVSSAPAVPSEATIQSPNLDKAAELTTFGYSPSKTSMQYPTAWQANSMDDDRIGRVSMIQESPTGNDTYIITFSEKSLTTRNTVVEVRDIVLDNGQSANLLFTRAPGIAVGNISDILLTSHEVAIADETPTASLDGVGSVPVFVTINLLPPNARNNSGRPIGDFTGARYEQVLQALKSIKKG